MFISAATGEGVDELLDTVMAVLRRGEGGGAGESRRRRGGDRRCGRGEPRFVITQVDGMFEVEGALARADGAAADRR